MARRKIRNGVSSHLGGGRRRDYKPRFQPRRIPPDYYACPPGGTVYTGGGWLQSCYNYEETEQGNPNNDCQFVTYYMGQTCSLTLTGLDWENGHPECWDPSTSSNPSQCMSTEFGNCCIAFDG